MRCRVQTLPTNMFDLTAYNLSVCMCVFCSTIWRNPYTNRQAKNMERNMKNKKIVKPKEIQHKKSVLGSAPQRRERGDPSRPRHIIALSLALIRQNVNIEANTLTLTNQKMVQPQQPHTQVKQHIYIETPFNTNRQTLQHTHTPLRLCADPVQTTHRSQRLPAVSRTQKSARQTEMRFCFKLFYFNC